MKENIDLNDFIKLLIEQKKVIFGIIITAIIISVIYALSATKYYKAYAYLLPPQAKYVEPLNVVDVDGDLITQESDPVNPNDIYTSFIRNVQSRKFQREYFFNNNIANLFDEESNQDESFENNFHENLDFELSAETTSREIRYQSFLTVTYIHTDPLEAASILNGYIDMAEKKTSKNFTDGINQSINNTRNSLIAEIEGERLLAKTITQDRIKRLEEAYVIAQKLGIHDRVDMTNSQNIIISDNKNTMAENRLYLYGTKSLRVEIDVLARRDSFDAFIPRLRDLEQKAEGLRNISVNSSDVRSAEIDQAANPPLHRFAPKRKVIVLMGGMIGGLISFIYLLYLMVIRREHIS